jgi:hypothetical protein
MEPQGPGRYPRRIEDGRFRTELAQPILRTGCAAHSWTIREADKFETRRLRLAPSQKVLLQPDKLRAPDRLRGPERLSVPGRLWVSGRLWVEVASSRILRPALSSSVAALRRSKVSKPSV